MRRLKSKHGPPPAVVAARIKAERERAGLTQERAAELMGVTRNSYRQYEVTANPQLSSLIAFKAIGMDPARIAPELFE